MSLRCAECGFLPDDHWIDWEKRSVLKLEYSVKMMKLLEGQEGVRLRDVQRLDLNESQAYLCQCESCFKLVVYLRSECPISDITGNTLHHVVKFAEILDRPIEEKPT